MLGENSFIQLELGICNLFSYDTRLLICSGFAHILNSHAIFLSWLEVWDLYIAPCVSGCNWRVSCQFLIQDELSAMVHTRCIQWITAVCLHIRIRWWAPRRCWKNVLMVPEKSWNFFPGTLNALSNQQVIEHTQERRMAKTSFFNVF